MKTCCNYSTHIVGTWHLGLSNTSMLPTSRGFDTHIGYWFGMQDHLHHHSYGVYDFNEGLRIATEYNNTFSTPIFTSAAVDIITRSAGSSEEAPYFLYLAYQDVHWPLQAPQQFIDAYADQTDGDIKRQRVCAMASHLDEAIGNITRAIDSVDGKD